MKYIISFTLAFVTLSGIGQLTYSDVFDDPHGNATRATVSIWELDANIYNLSIYSPSIQVEHYIDSKLRVGLKAKYQLGDHMTTNYLDGFEEPNRHYVIGVNEIPHASSLSLFGEYYFSSKEEKVEKMRIKIKGSSNYETYTLVPGTELTLFGAHIGYRFGGTWFNINGNDQQSFSYTTSSGTEQNESFQYASTFLEYSYMEFGIGRTIVRNRAIDIEGIGPRSSSSSTRIYGSLLLGLKQEMDDVYVVLHDPNAGTYAYEQATLSEELLNGIGFAAGYSYNGLAGGGISANAEFGYYPFMMGSTSLNLMLGFCYQFAFGTFKDI